MFEYSDIARFFPNINYCSKKGGLSPAYISSLLLHLCIHADFTLSMLNPKACFLLQPYRMWVTTPPPFFYYSSLCLGKTLQCQNIQTPTFKCTSSPTESVKKSLSSKNSLHPYKYIMWYVHRAFQVPPCNGIVGSPQCRATFQHVWNRDTADNTCLRSWRWFDWSGLVSQQLLLLHRLNYLKQGWILQEVIL